MRFKDIGARSGRTAERRNALYSISASVYSVISVVSFSA